MGWLTPRDEHAASGADESDESDTTNAPGLQSECVLSAATICLHEWPFSYEPLHANSSTPPSSVPAVHKSAATAPYHL